MDILKVKKLTNLVLMGNGETQDAKVVALALFEQIILEEAVCGKRVGDILVSGENVNKYRGLNKIEAIKQARSDYGLSLVKAKELVDAVQA